MALQLPTFNRISFQEANPLLTGMQVGQNMYSNYLTNALNQAKLPYAAQMAQQNLLKIQTENQLSGAKVPYASQMAKADLANKVASGQLTQEQADNYNRTIDAQIYAQKTEADKNRLIINNPGLLGGPEAQNIALAQYYKNKGGVQNNPLSQFFSNQTLTPDAQTKYGINQSTTFSNNTPNFNPSDLYQNLANANIAKEQGMANYYNMGGSQLGVGAKEVQNFQSQLMRENNWDANTALQAANAYISGKSILPDGTKLPDPSPLDIESMNRVTKYGTTAQNLNQQGYATLLDKWLDEGNKFIPNASKFAGLVGKSNKTVSQLESSMGKNNPVYNDYIRFSRQIVPLVSTQMLLTEGGKATDKQKQMMLDIAKPDYWDTNPQQALDNYRYLVKTFKNVISPSIAGSVIQRKQGLLNGVNNNTSSMKDPLGMR
jgi:hypothetical protein